MKISFKYKLFVFYLIIWIFNFFLVVASEPFGGFKLYLFVGGYDRYADTIKASFSLISNSYFEKNLISGISEGSLLSTYINGYKSFSYLNHSNTIFHHTPIVFSFFILFSLFLKIGINAYFLVFLVSIIIIIIILSYSKFLSNSYFFGIIIITCYPFIFALQRSNFASILNGVLLILATFLTVLSKKSSCKFLAFAINIRPNSLIYILSILINRKNFNIIKIIQIFLYAAIIFLSLLFINSQIYETYNFENFIIALNEYNKLYILGGAGDLYNSSLFILIKLVLPSKFFNLFFIISSIIIFIFSSFILYNENNFVIRSYIASCLYMFFTPVFATYHLIIFCTPILLFYYFYSNEDEVDISLKIILFTSFFFISPKFGFILNYINLDGIVTPLLAILSLFLLSKQKFKK
jgi:hypothetical protein